MLPQRIVPKKLPMNIGVLAATPRRERPPKRNAPRSAGLRPGANIRESCSRRIGDRRSEIWSAVTRHRFSEATCRRQIFKSAEIERSTHGSRQRCGTRDFSNLAELRRRQVACTKAVTSHRTPKRVCSHAPSRKRPLVCSPSCSRPCSEFFARRLRTHSRMFSFTIFPRCCHRARRSAARSKPTRAM